MSATRTGQRSAEEWRLIRDEREAALRLLRPNERALMERQIWGFVRLARYSQKEVLEQKRKHEAGSLFAHDMYVRARGDRFWHLYAAKSVKEDFAWYAREEEKRRGKEKHRRVIAKLQRRTDVVMGRCSPHGPERRAA